MERVQKTYQSIEFMQFDTAVMVNGQKVLLEFRGGSLDPKRNGTYQTNDPGVIVAMDATIKRAGKACGFECIHEDIAIIDEDDNKVKNLTEVPGITTVTAARQWLLEASEKKEIAEGITAGMIKNRTDVLRIADENNIKFVDLPTS